MRPVQRIALALLFAAPLSAPALAAEPDAPQALITRAEAIRIAVQNRLSGSVTDFSEHKKDEQGALVEFYAVPGQKLLWVDQNGITDRGKAVIAEIEKADDYGLRASDYALPDPSTYNPSDAKAAEWLADAELKISFAVLDYSYDARGGRITPLKVSRNLDPTLALPNGLEVIESIAIRSDPAAYLRSFQPNHPQFEALRQKLIELRGGNEPKEEAPQVKIPEGPVLKIGLRHEQVALLRKRLAMTAVVTDESIFDPDLAEAVRKFQIEHTSYPDGMVGPGDAAVAQRAASSQHGQSHPDQSHPAQHGTLALAPA
jgi:L,D-transpeptidase YcbB